MKKIICFSGTHGTGKTSLAYSICAFLKRRGENVIVLDEMARESPFPINQEGGDQTQIWMITTQIAREIELMRKYDYIITDRSMLDMCVYGEITSKLNVGGDRWIYKHLKPYILEHINEYYRHWYVLDPESFNFNFDDGVRDTDKKFRDDVHAGMMREFSSSGFPFKLVHSDIEVFSDMANL